MKQFSYISSIAFSIFLLSGCTSISLPDFAESPEFEAVAGDVNEYPDPGQAPQVPTDIRSADDWDKAANKMLTTQP